MMFSVRPWLHTLMINDTFICHLIKTLKAPGFLLLNLHQMVGTKVDSLKLITWANTHISKWIWSAEPVDHYSYIKHPHDSSKKPYSLIIARVWMSLDEADRAYLIGSVWTAANKIGRDIHPTKRCFITAHTMKREDQAGCILTGQLSGSEEEECK